VFHGQELGCSHPDVQAKHPVAVLFDEEDALKDCLLWWGQRANFRFGDAFSGNRSLWVAKDSGTQARLDYPKPYSECVPHWDFEIAENPRPGQYRYLQFAWKAGEPGTKNLSIRLNAVTFHAGPYVEINAGNVDQKVRDVPPSEWTVERVDLWEAFGRKPTRIRQLALAAFGGSGLFDRVLLGTSLKVLEAGAPMRTGRQ
jgi:hypothetical protein